MPIKDEYCPVAKSVEILGDRWCLLLIREMLRGVRRFNEMERAVPGISRSVLAQRLRHLERTGIVERRADGRSTEYVLTDKGVQLVPVVASLNQWGVQWVVPEARATPMDADGLMAWIGRHVMLDELPERRVVIRFDLRGAPRRHYWVVVQRGESSVCPEHPGFTEDIIVASDAPTLYRVFLGETSFATARARDSMRVDGLPALVRQMPRWFRLRATDAAESGAAPRSASAR